MDGECAIQKTRERREPIPITLADLAALVLGSALAISLPQMHLTTDRIAIGGAPMPGWIAWLFVIGEVAMKVSMALIPVILARRARYGCLPRPADWLSILVGLTLLHEVVRRSEWMKGLARWYFGDFRCMLGYPVSFSIQEMWPGNRIMGGDAIPVGYGGFPVDFAPGDEYRLWGWSAAFLFLATSVALLLGWKRMPGWAKTGLLSILAFTGSVVLTCLVRDGLRQAFQAFAARARLSTGIFAEMASGVAAAPESLLFGVPVVAILIQLRTGRISKWVWTERIGAPTALLALLTGVVICVYADLVLDATDPLATTRLTVQALRWVVLGLSSWIIVDRAGLAGTRTACS